MRHAGVFILSILWVTCQADMDSYRACLAKPNPDGHDESGEVNFVEAAISHKHRCTALRRNDCLFYHEATEKCKCLCQELVTSGKDSLGGPEKAAAKAQVLMRFVLGRSPLCAYFHTYRFVEQSKLATMVGFRMLPRRRSSYYESYEKFDENVGIEKK